MSPVAVELNVTVAFDDISSTCRTIIVSAERALYVEFFRLGLTLQQSPPARAKTLLRTLRQTAQIALQLSRSRRQLHPHAEATASRQACSQRQA